MKRKILSRSKSILKFISAISIFILFFYYGQNVPFEKQWPLYDGLRNTSAIIFGVMGAWIALIYPQALLSLSTRNHNSENVKKLLSPLIYSAVILAFVLVVGITAPILSQIPLFINNYRVVRGLSYSLLGYLTIFQLWTVILTLLPADLVKQNIDQIQNSAAARQRILSRTQSESKKN
jgi:hypothetical protein